MKKNKLYKQSKEYLTPKQELFLDYYYDVTNEDTFANAYRSALKAGYSESYARNVTTPSIRNMWLRENNRVSLTPDHITGLIEKIARKGRKEGDQLRALELLAKFHGMIVDKSENKNLNIEAALSELK